MATQSVTHLHTFEHKSTQYLQAQPKKLGFRKKRMTDMDNTMCSILFP